jgi:dTDP-4-dehydrorhamnose reductase
MVYSWDPKGMNFLMQYLRQLENPQSPFRIPKDQISTPTYGPALAEAVVSLRDQGIGGTFHLTGPDLLSRQALVEKVAAAFGFSEARLQAAFQFVKTSELGQAARRPLTAGLKTDKARAAGLHLDSLDEAFAKIKRLKES